MSDSPCFFVPAATNENQESVYAELSKFCGRTVPDMKHRIYSISFMHDREEWTATVGKKLKGIRRRIVRSRGQKIERTKKISDPAIVLAIFPGVPFMVVTNHRIVGNVGSARENPFMVGQPRPIVLFTIPEET